VSDVWECSQVYDEPTVLLAKRVTGEEEVPEGCVAVVTPDAPDVLSHVSVRARNMRVLFAVCHERAPLKEIEKLAGKVRAAHAQEVHTLISGPCLRCRVTSVILDVHRAQSCVLYVCHPL